jgi:hypothetical protein
MWLTVGVVGEEWLRLAEARYEESYRAEESDDEEERPCVEGEGRAGWADGADHGMDTMARDSTTALATS